MNTSNLLQLAQSTPAQLAGYEAPQLADFAALVAKAKSATSVEAKFSPLRRVVNDMENDRRGLIFEAVGAFPPATFQIVHHLEDDDLKIACLGMCHPDAESLAIIWDAVQQLWGKDLAEGLKIYLEKHH